MLARHACAPSALTRWLLLLLCGLSLAVMPLEGWAAPKRKPKKPAVTEEPAPPEPKQAATARSGPRRVIVLKLENFNTSSQVMDLFYKSAQTLLTAKPDVEPAPGGHLTINELVVTMGCDESSLECLASLGDVLSAEQILFGSIQRSENIHLITLKLFDLKEKMFVRTIEDQTIEGGMDALSEGIPAAIEALLYGQVGALEIGVQGAQSPEVYFDGEKVGRAPTQLSNLPLGEHVIKLRSVNGNERTQRVILRQGKTSTLEFTFDEVIDPNATLAPPRSPLIIPGWVSAGLGAAALGFGAYHYTVLNGLEDEAANRYPRDARAVAAEDRAQIEADLNARQADMNTAYTRMNVGLSVGITGLVLGAGMLIYGYTSGAEAPAPSSLSSSSPSPKRPAPLQVHVSPTPGGAAFAVDMPF